MGIFAAFMVWSPQYMYDMWHNLYIYSLCLVHKFGHIRHKKNQNTSTTAFILRIAKDNACQYSQNKAEIKIKY